MPTIETILPADKRLTGETRSPYRVIREALYDSQRIIAVLLDAPCDLVKDAKVIRMLISPRGIGVIALCEILASPGDASDMLGFHIGSLLIVN